MLSVLALTSTMRPAASATTMLPEADSRNAREVASLRRSDASVAFCALMSRLTIEIPMRPPCSTRFS